MSNGAFLSNITTEYIKARYLTIHILPTLILSRMRTKSLKAAQDTDLTMPCPMKIEHIYPDYSIYPKLTKDTSYGFLTRGCPRHCDFCIVGDKEGLISRKVANLSEFWRGQKNIELLDPNILACKDRMELLNQLAKSKAKVNFSQGLDIRLTNKDIAKKLSEINVSMFHFAWDNPKQDLTKQFRDFTENYHNLSFRNLIVYVLVNFNSTMEENLYRIYTLKALGYSPYIMVYDKPNAPLEIKRLQRWVNNRFIFRSCETFEDYMKVAKSEDENISKLF